MKPITNKRLRINCTDNNHIGIPALLRLQWNNCLGNTHATIIIMGSSFIQYNFFSFSPTATIHSHCFVHPPTQYFDLFTFYSSSLIKCWRIRYDKVPNKRTGLVLFAYLLWLKCGQECSCCLLCCPSFIRVRLYLSVLQKILKLILNPPRVLCEHPKRHSG